MDPARHFLVIDDSVDPAQLVDDLSTAEERGPFTDLVILCWLSPETLGHVTQRHPHLHIHPLDRVVGSIDAWDTRALETVERWVDVGPSHRGIPCRLLVEEQLFREAWIVEVIRMANDLATGRVSLAIRPERVRLFRVLRPDAVEVPLGIPSDTEQQQSRSLPARLVRRWRRARTSGDVLGQLWDAAMQLDPTYRVRSALARLRPEPRLQPGGITFFSSYSNNSRSLRWLADQLGDDLADVPVHWVVTNRLARRGVGRLRPHERVHALWRFRGSPTHPFENLAAPEDLDPAVGEWLAHSPTWVYWTGAGHTSMARWTQWFERHLELARPRLVVVASQWAVEGWICRLAAAHGVPVLQVNHGIFDGLFYSGRPVLSEALVTWGAFWRDQWPPSERQKIVVAAPPGARPKTGPTKTGSTKTVSNQTGRRLTYFSWPLDLLPFYNGAELLDGFVDLLHQRLVSGEIESLILRAHPLENLSDLTRHWQRRHGTLPDGVTLSQQEPLADVLDRTDIALMYRSTVMLEAFERGIPFLLPGWIPFPWIDALRGIDSVHVARDFDDLGSTLDAWLTESPAMDRRQTLGFVAAPQDDDGARLRALVGRWLG